MPQRRELATRIGSPWPTRLRYALGVVAAAALLAFALPSIAGVPLRAVEAVVAEVPLLSLGALLLVWVTGLVSHTLTLTAALPTLTHRRALTLSLTGSAVANVLPLGGAAGVALNYRMLQGWGFNRSQFATYTVVTNVWDVLAKLTLAAVAFPLLALFGHAAVHGRWFAGVVPVAGTVAVLLVLVATVIASPRIAAAVGSFGDRLGSLLRPSGPDTRRFESALVDLQASSSRVVRSAWPRLSLGMLLYLSSLGLLLGGCLELTGAQVPPIAVLTGLAVERLLTMAGLTPGGAGIVEVGLTGFLLLLGGDPTGVVAGVLLYRAVTFGLEIPVGGAGIAAWLWLRRRRADPGLAAG